MIFHCHCDIKVVRFSTVTGTVSLDDRLCSSARAHGSLVNSRYWLASEQLRWYKVCVFIRPCAFKATV